MIKINVFYATRSINVLSIIISIIFFLIINFNLINPLEKNLNHEKNNQNDKISKIVSENKINEDNNKKDTNNENDIENNYWLIEIPSISLKAPISEGTDENTLKEKVGHFNDTGVTYGNIGLAAHNRRIPN